MSDTSLKVIDNRMKENEALPQVQSDSPNAVVMMAMQRGYTPELIEKMMDLAERNQANIARQAFYEALANFKAEAPPVKKDKYNKYFNSYYTSLGVLLATYNPVLGRHGLSLSFPPKDQTEKTMTVECRLAHRLGHTESISMSAPIDQAAIGKQSGQRSRNPIQDIKSTFTYLRSATCEAILGVAGTEATIDDDGNSARGGLEFITPKQVKEISNLIAETDSDNETFWEKIAKAATVEEILASNYKFVLTRLKDKAAKQKKEGNNG